MLKELKKKTVKTIKEKFDKSSVVILTDYSGLTMAQLTKLRKKLRPSEAEFKVFKNTLITLAVKDMSLEGIDKLLKGSTAVVFGYKDQVQPTKALSDFIKENEKLSIKGGLLDGNLIDIKTISALSKLPSREVLLAKVAGGMKAPITNFVLDCKAIITKFAIAVNAVKEKKAKG